MNLIKNVEGDWSNAKGRVRGDLDTIQRAFNGLQAQLAALIKQVNTPDPVPAATISAANQVTVPTGNFLSVVATNGGLTGDGTPANPLVATGGSGSVVVDPAGALDGDGTGGSPLAVRVDGVSISINGSNELEAAASLPELLKLTFTITEPQMQILNSSPVTLLSGSGGFLLVPVMLVTHTVQDTQFASTVSCTIRYSSNVDDLTNSAVMIRGSLSPGSTYHISAFATAVANVTPATTVDPSKVPIGADLILKGNNDSADAGGAVVTAIHGTLYYLNVAV